MNSFLIALFLSAAGAVHEPFTVEPPAQIRKLIERLQEGDRVETAVKELGSLDAAAPYLRADIGPVHGRRDYRPDLRAALDRIEARIEKRNATRFQSWIETGRFDLCAEIIIQCRDDALAVKLANATLPQRRRIAEEWGKRTGRDLTSAYAMEFPPRPRAEATVLSGKIVSSNEYSTVFVRADRLVSGTMAKIFWVVAARSHREAVPTGLGTGYWEDSFLMVNGDMQARLLRHCLIICDGDFELPPAVEGCVIIANGKIHSKFGGGGSDTFLAATGDINLPARRPRPGSNRVKENQDVLPFGIRFFDPKELGLELSAHDDGVRVSKLAADSLFTRFGVETGDVITRMDDVESLSIPESRRALRRGVVRDSVTLHIRRGGQALTRIVFLDGIPLPVAPAPRAVAR